MLFFILIILLFIGFYFFIIESQKVKLIETVTKLNRGTNSERDLVLKLLKHKIPAENIFHDLYLRKRNGKFSQIDLVVTTKVGIIVFEVKDFSGWIFGSGNNNVWTQVLAYGKIKHRHYNPVLQNNKHIEELKINLQNENIPFFSVIVFYGDCELKDINFIPKGTFIVKEKRVLEVFDIITKENNSVNYNNKKILVEKLKTAVKNGENIENQKRHIENIEEMLGKDRIFD